MGTMSFGSGRVPSQPTYYGTQTPEKWRQEANPALGSQVSPTLADKDHFLTASAKKGIISRLSLNCFPFLFLLLCSFFFSFLHTLSSLFPLAPDRVYFYLFFLFFRLLHVSLVSLSRHLSLSLLSNA